MDEILSIIGVVIICVGVIGVFYHGIQFAKEMSKLDKM